MAKRIRRWHSDGKRVKIFTARAANPKAIPYVKKWLKDHNLPDLEVTNAKDHLMTRLWDDRAVPMVKNKGITHQDGRIAESIVDILLDGKRYDAMADEEEAGRFGDMSFTRNPNWKAYWMDPTGELIQVPHHESWARKVVLKGTPFEDKNVAGAYNEMRKRGWVRVVVQPRTNVVFVNPQHCTRAQLDNLIDFCAENGFDLVDEASRGEPTIFRANTGSVEDPEVTKFY